MRHIRFTYIFSFYVLSLAAIQTAHGCFPEKEITNINSNSADKIFSMLESSTKKERNNYFICGYDNGIYKLAENILKSNFLTDVQKLEYYYRIIPLYPNNTELGSGLRYDIIKLFSKYKGNP